MSGSLQAKVQWTARVLGVNVAPIGAGVGGHRAAQLPTAPPRPSTPLPDTADQKAYKEAYANIKAADARVDGAKRGSEVTKLGVAFKAIPMPPDPANVAVFSLALADAQSKLALAQPIEEANDYDYAESWAMPAIRKAGVYTKQSGAMKGQENANKDVLTLATKAATALKQKDYVTAEALLKDAGNRAREVNMPYDTLVRIEQNKPLFARAEKLIKQKAVTKEFAKNYSQESKSLAAALKTTNYKDWESTFKAKRTLADQIVRDCQAHEVDAWFDGQQAQPATGTGSGGGIATGLATMPNLSAMSEAEKFDAMSEQYGIPTDRLKTQVTDLYAQALFEGQKLDLSPAQIAAAAGYSGTNYDSMNGLLRGSLDITKVTPKKLDLLKVQIDLLCQTLEKLPDYDPGGFPLFRWETPYGDYLQSRYQVASPVFEIKEFWSTGAGGGSAVGAVTTEIVIWGKKQSKAKSISMLSLFGGSEGSRADGGRLKGQGAGEVLFAPGTKFKTRTFKAFDKANKEVLERIDSKSGRAVDFHYRVEIEEV